MRRSEHHQEVHERHCSVKVANPSETRGFVSYLGSPGGGNFQSSARVFASALYLCFASSSSDTGPWPSIVTLLLAQQPMAPVSCSDAVTSVECFSQRASPGRRRRRRVRPSHASPAHHEKGRCPVSGVRGSVVLKPTLVYSWLTSSCSSSKIDFFSLLKSNSRVR